jgi:hypothetical protein
MLYLTKYRTLSIKLVIVLCAIDVVLGLWATDHLSSPQII